ncbi:hypothetical protein RFI_11953 [Reticulomyxa filosa]|uniref:Uncharacterized protein n=1 Tax=Reticulomyxa filosa TaxID=46433 RepID=X6NIL2_RETFI|nr:hypothetical protein RFI_11953 [Reticulomyxa filosa]|eukprot:ETO25187.1 hypothetical protein RFI_11953 [Reticulomyxa filosa]
MLNNSNFDSVLENAGYIVKYFTEEQDAINYCHDRNNKDGIQAIIATFLEEKREKICAAGLFFFFLCVHYFFFQQKNGVKTGYEGNRVKKAISITWQKKMDEDEAAPPPLPTFAVHELEKEEFLNGLVSKRVLLKARKKVMTHRSQGTYKYTLCEDVSETYPKIDFELAKLTLVKSYSFKNQATKKHYDEMLARFIRHNNKDEHYTFSETMSLRGFKDKMLVKLGGKPNAMPWYVVYICMCGYLCSYVCFVAQLSC